MISNILKYVPSILRIKIENKPNIVKIIDNFGWLFFDKVLRMGVGLLVGVWIARYLGPEQFGLINFAMAFTGLFGAIATMGLQEIIVRDIVKNPSEAHLIIETGFILRLIGGLISFLIIIGVINYLRPHDVLSKAIVLIYGFTLIIQASEVVKYWFESQVYSKVVVWIENGIFLIITIVKICMILLNASILAFVFAAFAEALLVALSLLFIYKKKVGQILHKRLPDFILAKKLLIDSWPLILSGLAISVYMRIDQIMLGQLSNDQAVGIYSAAVRISEIWYFIPLIIVASVFPSIIDSKKKDEKTYIARMQKLFDLMILLSLAVVIPLSFLSTVIINILFGPDYVSSAAILKIHIWASVFVFMGTAGSKWFLIENRQILHFQRTFLGAIINILLNLLLIPKYNAIGAAYATVIAYSISAFFSDLLQKETRPLFRMKLYSLNVIRTIINMSKK